MKTIKLIFLLVILVMSSCQPKKKYDNPFHDHILYMSIRDASGNDKVKGLEYDEFKSDATPIEGNGGGLVKRDLYTLEIGYTDLCQDAYYAHYHSGGIEPDDNFPEVAVAKMPPGNRSDGYYYLSFQESSLISEDCPEVGKLTFKLKCPHIFGDDAVHDIVTWWKPDPDYDGVGIYARLCYRIEIEGKEFTRITYEFYNQISIASVVL